MKILAIDLGKFKSAACVYESSTGEHSFTTVRTKPGDIHDLLTTHRPHRVVVEIGSAAGWVHDMALPDEILVLWNVPTLLTEILFLENVRVILVKLNQIGPFRKLVCTVTKKVSGEAQFVLALPTNSTRTRACRG